MVKPHSLLEIFIQYCSGLNCGPLKYAHLEPQNVTLYEIRVFVDVIKVPLDGFTLEKSCFVILFGGPVILFTYPP